MKPIWISRSAMLAVSHAAGCIYSAATLSPARTAKDRQFRAFAFTTTLMSEDGIRLTHEGMDIEAQSHAVPGSNFRKALKRRLQPGTCSCTSRAPGNQVAPRMPSTASSQAIAGTTERKSALNGRDTGTARPSAHGSNALAHDLALAALATGVMEPALQSIAGQRWAPAAGAADLQRPSRIRQDRAHQRPGIGSKSENDIKLVPRRFNPNPIGGASKNLITNPDKPIG